MSLISLLSDPHTWAEFREYKSFHSHISNRELKALDEFIAQKRYLAVTSRVTIRSCGFFPPRRRVINKSGTRKKRVIYMYSQDETYVLKLLTWMLYRYDGKIHPSCYSFRRKVTAKDAVADIINAVKGRRLYALKADIHDYFNSMPAHLLVRELESIIDDDPELLAFLSDLLLADVALDENGNEIKGNRGAMAGVPVSAFFANVYLRSLDELFESLGCAYYRYSDDILIFAETPEDIERYKGILEEHIALKGLEMNPEKYALSSPGEPWEFLGFRFENGRIDLSRAAVNKMKGKMSRKCRALYRWKIKKGVDFDRAAKVVIRIFNQKFYDTDELEDFTWSRWFFPVLTTDKGLRELDTYLLENLRYINSGRHYKGNYAVTYEKLKQLGFRSLVHEYYKFKKNKENDTASG